MNQYKQKKNIVVKEGEEEDPPRSLSTYLFISRVFSKSGECITVNMSACICPLLL